MFSPGQTERRGFLIACLCLALASCGQSDASDEIHEIDDERFREVQSTEDWIRSMPSTSYSECLKSCVQQFTALWVDILTDPSKDKLLADYQICAKGCEVSSRITNPDSTTTPPTTTTPPSTQPIQPTACSSSMGVNGTSYEVSCDGIQCSCKMNGQEVMRCSYLSTGCSSSVGPGGVSANCCRFTY